MREINILLIEDNKADSRLIYEMLKGNKEVIYNIDTAALLSEGMALLKENRYHILLLDLGLPDSYGLNTLEIIMEKYPDLPVVVFTVMGAENLGIDAIESGAQDYLVKDETVPALLARSIQYSITRNNIESRIKIALREKEILLKELAHRVKNNLQVILSLINIKIGSVKDEQAKTIIKDIQNNIKSLGLIHDQLNKSVNLASINFKDYLNELINNLKLSFNLSDSNVTYHVDSEEIYMAYDTVVSLGLIINEAVTNSLKHAFNGNEGFITINVNKMDDEMVELTVKDNGKGIPDSVLEGDSGSVGMMLISLLTEQINGKLEVENKNGTLFRFRFKVNNELAYSAVSHIS